MFLVLAVLGVQAVCGVHPHAADHGSTSTRGAVGQYASSAGAVSVQAVSVQAGHAEHPGQGSNHCAEDRTVTARYDRAPSPSMDLAGPTSLALRWLVPDLASQGHRAPSGLAVAAAPSLHALGISRT